MSKSINVPKLRFKEFSGEWEEKTLGEISSKVLYGIGSSAIAYDGVNKYLRITDIDESSRTFIPNPLTSPGGDIEEKYKLVVGDLVFARTGASTGKSYLYNEKDGNLIYAGFLIKFHIDKANPYFVYTNTFKEQYYKWVQIMSMRSGQPGINAEEYKLLPLFLPSKQEQEKIASFLTSVDIKIEQLTKKEELLLQYKKGVMQKIFNQEIRFKADDGSGFCDWEWKYGNEIFETITNKNHNSELPVLAITQEYGAIPRDMIDYQISVTDKSVATYKVVEIGDFIISLRSFQGGIEYSNYKGICSPAYIILRPHIEVEDRLYKLYMKTDNYIKELNKNIEGIRDGKMISFKQFSEIKLPYPSIEEQTKIANFLSFIDQKIEQVQKQLNSTKEFKKALLQQMFV